MSEETVAIFRKEPDGEILAVFPYEPAHRYDYMMCYSHIGQHGVCTIEYFHMDTRPAREEEHKELEQELIERGYQLRIMKRINWDRYREARYEATKKP